MKIKKKKASSKDGSNKKFTIDELQEQIRKLKIELKHTKAEAAKWNIDVSQLVADRYNVMLCLYSIAKKEKGLARDYIRGMMTIPRYEKDFQMIKKMHNRSKSIIADIKKREEK